MKTKYMKSRNAKYCLDCQGLYTGRTCPVCGSSASWPLMKWLDRQDDYPDMVVYPPEKHQAAERYAA